MHMKQTSRQEIRGEIYRKSGRKEIKIKIKKNWLFEKMNNIDKP